MALSDKERAVVVDELIRGIYSSLESHLSFMHADNLVAPDDNDFHKKCVVEYAHLITLAVKLL
jgi:hypothetical protein